ncbi:hypothetical protein [Nodularia sp. NIES-3585]|uniref:hypothetical protein n=1 Tax=Nodularia sp. NIES-3585 TaxID=1973477 RepID=UPI000B70F1FB|nr:hypothetical protein [Nodularia sp. NIES-3585]GAX38518.1 hypothetical protein NIES3585_45670 [Nodularia sp. NIES-3585]
MQGFRLGSIFGFEIRVDLSWFLIFFLVLWTLSVGLFPTNYPGFDSTTYFAMGIVDIYFLSRRYHSFPVTENSHPVGIITLNQVKDIPR